MQLKILRIINYVNIIYLKAGIVMVEHVTTNKIKSCQKHNDLNQK